MEPKARRLGLLGETEIGEKVQFLQGRGLTSARRWDGYNKRGREEGWEMLREETKNQNWGNLDQTQTRIC